MSELWLFEILTSEAEIEVKTEVKTEARDMSRRSRSTTMPNFSRLAWKMSELWIFEILTSEVEVEAGAKAEVKTEARYI